MTITIPGVVGNGEVYMKVLDAITGPFRNSMIDLGCCHAPHTPRLGFRKKLYIDALPRQLDIHQEQEFFVQGNVLEVKPEDGKYDVAFGLDLIEHFTLEDAPKLLSVMDLISNRQVLFTPLGNMWLSDDMSNPEGHKSGWYPEMLPGYASIVYPDYHKYWGFGAFFFWKCDDIENDFLRVKNLL